MRYLGFVAATLLLLGCGPDPNAKLPEIASSGKGGASSTGGTGAGGSVTEGTGGASGTGGSSATSASGGRPETGGRVGTGGSSGSGGSTTLRTGGRTGSRTGGTTGAGGVTGGTGNGGRVGTGGTTSAPGGTSGGGATGRGGRTGTGGTVTPTTGELTLYTFGPGEEPCTPAKDVSGGQSGSFGTTGAYCFRTADDFTEYQCSGDTGRTLKINGTAITTCGGKAPAKLGSFYYFDFGPGTYEYTSVSWYCSTAACLGPHPVPSCGSYPAWVPGGSAPPCSN